MLRWRLFFGSLLIVALIALCWLDLRASFHLLYEPMPGLWLLPIAVLACMLATHEVLQLAAAANLRPVAWPVYCGNLLIVTGHWLFVGICHWFWKPGAVSASSWPFDDFKQTLGPAWTLAAAMILVFLVEMRRFDAPGRSIANLAAACFALMYVGLLLNFAVHLRITWGVGAFLSWILVVKMADTGAYFVGRFLGRHKMTPVLSPGKTIEGAVGALVASCLGSWLAFHYVVPLVGDVKMVAGAGPWWGWLVFGVLVGAAGIVGDLAESLLKRDVGRKDSSTWLPGFGGVLDILDSLLLSAPVAWFCWAHGLIGPIRFFANP